MVIVFSGILYLANINDIAIKGFKIKELDEKESELVEKIKKAEYEVAELQSVQNLKERVSSLNMVSVTSTEYASTASAVAVR